MQALIFHRVGPYHRARLIAAGRLGNLVAIQGCSRDRTYAWAELSHEGCYQLETLFLEGDSDDHPPALVRRRLIEILTKVNPSVVVAPGWSGCLALVAVEWCLHARRPAIVMSESQEKDEKRRAWSEAVKRRIVSCFSAALVGGASHADYIAQLGMPRDRIFLGYDAVDNSYFADRAAKAESQEERARSEYGLPKKYFLASARFVKKKNLPHLLQAYALYRAKCQVPSAKCEPLDLILLGDGPLRETINQQLSAFNLQPHVHLPGFKQYPDLPAYYGLASAFIHASTTEQWGLVVNEAMASGLPVLVSNRCGCAPDLVLDGINGFTFDPYDVEDMASVMLRFASMDDAKRKEFGAKSAEIIANWGPERFASGLKAAVVKALEVGPVKSTLLQRALLAALMRRCW